jgi:hypothetical protein
MHNRYAYDYSSRPPFSQVLHVNVCSTLFPAQHAVLPPHPSFLTCFMSMWHGFKSLFSVPLVLMTQLWTKFMSEPREESVQSIRLIPWWWREHAPLKRLSASTWLHGDISQKTLNFILAAVRTWNLTYMQVTCFVSCMACYLKQPVCCNDFVRLNVCCTHARSYEEGVIHFP